MSTIESAAVVAAHAFAVDHIVSLGYDRQSTEIRPWFHVERRINQHATMFAVAISGFYTVDIKATSKGMTVVACLLQPNVISSEAAPVVVAPVVDPAPSPITSADLVETASRGYAVGDRVVVLTVGYGDCNRIGTVAEILPNGHTVNLDLIAADTGDRPYYVRDSEYMTPASRWDRSELDSLPRSTAPNTSAAPAADPSGWDHIEADDKTAPSSEDAEFAEWLNEPCEVLAPVFSRIGESLVSRIAPARHSSGVWFKARRIGSGIARFLESAVLSRSPVAG